MYGKINSVYGTCWGLRLTISHLTVRQTPTELPGSIGTPRTPWRIEATEGGQAPSSASPSLSVFIFITSSKGIPHLSLPMARRRWWRGAPSHQAQGMPSSVPWAKQAAADFPSSLRHGQAQNAFPSSPLRCATHQPPRRVRISCHCK